MVKCPSIACWTKAGKPIFIINGGKGTNFWLGVNCYVKDLSREEAAVVIADNNDECEVCEFWSGFTDGGKIVSPLITSFTN